MSSAPAKEWALYLRNRLEKEMNEAESDRKAGRARRDKALQTLQTMLTKETAQLQATIKSLTSQNASLTEELQYAQEEIAELTDQVNACEEKQHSHEKLSDTKTRDMKRAIKDLEADNTALFQRNKALDTKLQDVQKHSTKLEKAKKSLEEAYKDAASILEACHDSKARTVQDLKQNVIKPLQEKIAQLQDALSECEQVSKSLSVTSRALAGSSSLADQPFQRPRPPYVSTRRRPSRANP